MCHNIGLVVGVRFVVCVDVGDDVDGGGDDVGVDVDVDVDLNVHVHIHVDLIRNILVCVSIGFVLDRDLNVVVVEVGVVGARFGVVDVVLDFDVCVDVDVDLHVE